eukprot:CAMPEP_0172514102 /NCGR_PEP_ID=MMETSP1066-20121228/257442_1 /TAXON_ID=671091 /ORGANISM="Coscinodiscus wailesii, Strain CCMP2513" /LENGTH=293 /DNA_ID=CAMNT_0013294633 /DNA_START=71 /DNA_END=949 /DNA_ORIENTATION=+
MASTTVSATNKQTNNDSSTGNLSKRKLQEKSAPLTLEGEMPQKKYYRSRAHCNPLSHNDTFSYPTNPTSETWKSHYPDIKKPMICPNVLDIGCGFGGLTISLATLLPQHTILGMEIRAKVTEYVRLRIMALRKEFPGQYQNCSVMRTNAMKFLPHYFPKESVDKLFFCFPDPHFKRKNHPRRIISDSLLSEYAYILQVGGRLYCVTDVEDLHNWHVEKLDNHPLFRKVDKDEIDKDTCAGAMVKETEEGKKVERAGSEKYFAVYERIEVKEVDIVDKFWMIGQFGVINMEKTP